MGQGWSADSKMDLLGPCLAQHSDQLLRSGPPDDGIVHHNDAFPPQHTPDRIEFDQYPDIPGRLARMDKGSANIVIANQSQFEPDTRLLSISHRGRIA